MKKIVVLASLIALFFASCNKHGDPPSFWKTIDGVNLKDAQGDSIGIIGIPDVFTEDSTVSLFVIQNPCSDTLRYKIVNKTNNDYSTTVELFTAEFKNMPREMPSNFGIGSFPIENNNLSGAFSVKKYGNSLTAGEFTTVGIVVSDLPRGFYKLLITTSEGKKYWDNIWIYRP